MNVPHIWIAGDPAPVRPAEGSPDYARELERYADNLERMLIWLVRDYAAFPNKIAAAMREAVA